MSDKKAQIIIIIVMILITIAVIIFSSFDKTEDIEPISNNEIEVEVEDTYYLDDFDEPHTTNEVKTYYNLLMLYSELGESNLSILTLKFDDYFKSFPNSDVFIIDEDSIKKTDNVINFKIKRNSTIYSVVVELYGNINETIKEVKITP